MKILRRLANFYLKISTEEVNTTSSKQDALIKQGREQFKRLLEKGLTVPVVLL